MMMNCFINFAVEHRFGCRANESGYAGDIGAGAGIAERVSALDTLSLPCAAIIMLHARTPACAPKKGTLRHLLHLWTEMQMLVPSAETDFIGDFRH